MKQLSSLKKLSTQAEKAVDEAGQLLDRDNVALTLRDMKIYLAVRAVEDEAFKQELLQDPKAVWSQEFSNLNLTPVVIEVLEETPDTLYLVIPNDAEKLRRDLVRRPKSIWQQEFGTHQLSGYTVRVVEETTTQLYLVLPYAAQNNDDTKLPLWYRQTQLPAPLKRSPQEEQNEAEGQERQNAIARFVKQYRANQIRVLPKGQVAKWFYYLGIGRVLRQVFRKPLDLIYKARNFVFRLMRPKI